MCLGEGERERLQLSMCQPLPSPVLSTSPHLYSLSHGAEQRGVRKASLSLPLLLHLSASFHHSWVGNVKQKVIAPLLDMLSASSSPSNRVASACVVLVSVKHPSSISWSSSVWHEQCLHIFLATLCAFVIARLKGHYPWTLECDDSPETKTPDVDPEFCIISACHTCLTSLCIRDVECTPLSNVTSFSDTRLDGQQRYEMHLCLVCDGCRV